MDAWKYEIYFSCRQGYLSRLLRSLVRYAGPTLKINFIFPHIHVYKYSNGVEKTNCRVVPVAGNIVNVCNLSRDIQELDKPRLFKFHSGKKDFMKACK